MNQPIPLLIISDAPSAETGLARITRDLATRIAANLPEVFRVATFGYGGSYSRAFPFPQYTIEGMKDWVLPTLPEVWKDFAGAEKGIILTIWDGSRMLWFARPESCPAQHLRKFLTNPPFQKWGYFPIDATGPHDKLTAILRHTIEGYDRVLAYSKWAAGILRRTFTAKEMEVDFLPHGIDTSVFQPRNRHAARHGFGQRLGLKTNKGRWLAIPDDSFFIGIVATNQIRKDYGLGVAAVAELAKERNVLLWIHTDELERHWSTPALVNDFGLVQNTVFTTLPFTDEQMSWNYSACDVTLGIGLGEGYGYPIFESLACGTPVVHGNYGGAAEHLPEHMLVWPNDSPIDVPMRLEGIYNCYRPVYDPRDWARRAGELSKTRTGVSLLPSHLDWDNLWLCWEEWLQKGLHESGDNLP